MVTIYACTIEGQGGIYYWKNEGDEPVGIGDYVIVANNKGFSLAKIIGKISCLEKDVSLFSRTKYENMKNIIYTLDLDRILDDFDERVLGKHATRLGDDE